jgi:hypothetical protein
MSFCLSSALSTSGLALVEALFFLKPSFCLNRYKHVLFPRSHGMLGFGCALITSIIYSASMEGTKIGFIH